VEADKQQMIKIKALQGM